MKPLIIITILFFCFIFGLPMGAMMKTAQTITGEDNIEKVYEDMERKKAKLKAEHEKQLAINMEALHNGTYKPRPWKGLQIGNE